VIKEKESDPPHIILIPEIPFDEEYVLKKIKETVVKVG